MMYIVRRLAGRTDNGRPVGERYHAIEVDGIKALCGVGPGRNSRWEPKEQRPTNCPRCMMRLRSRLGDA